MTEQTDDASEMDGITRLRALVQEALDLEAAGGPASGWEFIFIEAPPDEPAPPCPVA